MRRFIRGRSVPSRGLVSVTPTVIEQIDTALATILGLDRAATRG